MKPTKQELETLFITENKTAREIASLLNLTKYQIQHLIRDYEFKKSYKVTWNEDLISDQCPVFNYLMGLAVTDGNIDADSPRLSIRLATYDRNVLDVLSEFYSLSTGVRLYKQGQTADITMPSKKLIEVAKAYGVVPQKTYDVGVPQDFASEDCMRMYLRGVLDGDGNIHFTTSKRGLSVRLYCGSEKFSTQLVDLLNKRFGYGVKLRYMTTRGKQYPGFEFGGDNAIEFLNWVYEGHELFRIERKFDRFQLVKSNRMKR